MSDSTAFRAARRCFPAVEQAGRDTMRMPGPGRGRRKTLPARLADTPGLAVVIDPFKPRTHRPRRRPRADDSGKKKAHMLTSQVEVDEESGRLVGVSDAVPGPWADTRLLRKSLLRKRPPEGVGGIGDLGDVGVADLPPAGLGPPPGGSPGGRTARPRPGGTTGHSAAAGPWSSTPSAGCGGFGPWPT